MEQIKQIPTEFIGRGEVRGFKYSKLDSPNGGFIYAVDNNGTKYYECNKRQKKGLIELNYGKE